MLRLAQEILPIDELREFGQTSINIEGMLVMTMFTFALMGLMFMLFKLKTSGQLKSGDLTPALQTLGGVIANQMKDVVEDAKADRALFMESFAAQSREHTGITDALKDIANILTGHTNKVDANQTAIKQLSTDQQQTNTQVTDMNGDIKEIKQLLKTALQALDSLSKNILLILEKLEEETEAPTEEAPVIETPKVLEPIPKPGVPVTPKPTIEKPKKEKTQ
jgi:septal ring factor EnvC (AmiA/AmiB activator)